MPYRSLDSRISSAIALAVRRSHPQFDHHLRGLGVARYIQEVSRQELESLFLAGEIALTSCLTKYLCQRSTAAMAYCGTIRTRVLSPQTYELLIAQAGCSTVDSSIADLCLPFVGALLSKFGFRCIFEWFVAAFGPLVDDATDACDEYNIDSALRTHNSKKRAHSRGEEPGAKRAKHTLSERKSFQFAEVKAMIKDLTSGTDPSLKVPSNEMLLTATLNAPSSTADIFDKIDILSILQPPTTDIEILTSPSLAVPFSFSHFSSFAQEHISEFMTGVSAFAQREVAEYHSAARGASIFSLPLAFIEGFISALATDTKRLATPISIPSPPSTSEPRLPLPYRRSRALSPPSPRQIIPLKTNYYSNLAAPATSTKPKKSTHPATTFSIHQIPGSLRTWYPKLAMQSTSTRKRRHASSSSIPSHNPTSHSLSPVIPTPTTLGFGRHRNVYQHPRGFL